MARTEDVAMQNYRQIRRRMNDRLARALKEGRLDEEMKSIEREGRRVYREAVADLQEERSRAKKGHCRRIGTA